MMKPDRSNYEIWFIDWLDGKLNESQIAELRSFLGDNPDLKEELEMLPFLELKPEEKEFRGKADLVKTAESYLESQFEYLCVASLENDLTPDQSEELMEYIGRDEEKKKSFDLISRLKLTPDDVSFPGKSRVKRLTMPRRILRIASVGVPSAAAVALLITAWIFLKPHQELNNKMTSAISSGDTLLIGYSPALYSSTEKPAGKPEIAEKRRASKPAPEIISEDFSEFEPQQVETRETVSVREPFSVDKAEADNLTAMGFIKGPMPNTLAGYNPGIMPPTFDPYGRRSNVDRFMARFFHEKIMRDKTAGDRPVGSYELAEAGIKGLNKLLRWEINLPVSDSKERK